MTNYIVLRRVQQTGGTSSSVGAAYSLLGVVPASGPDQAIRQFTDGATDGEFVAVPTRNWTARKPYVPTVEPPTRLAALPTPLPGPWADKHPGRASR